MTTTTTPDVKQLPVRLPVATYSQLKNLAFFTDRSMNEIVVTALTQFLATTGEQEQAEAMLAKAKGEYREVLDKLKHL